MAEGWRSGWSHSGICVPGTEPVVSDEWVKRAPGAIRSEQEGDDPPNGVRSTVGRRSESGDGIEKGPRGKMLGGGRLKEDDMTIDVSYRRM